MHIWVITFLCETDVPDVYSPTGGFLCGKKIMRRKDNV
jgi:hypothetical protein